MTKKKEDFIQRFLHKKPHKPNPLTHPWINPFKQDIVRQEAIDNQKKEKKDATHKK